jgi:hypothetical protein
VIAPVTVSQVIPAASGRCLPALTGVGVVPWIQSQTVIAVPSASRIRASFRLLMAITAATPSSPQLK